MKQGSLRSSAYAVLTAFIWGTAFVAQSVGAEHVPPLAFNAARSVIAFVFLLVLCAVMRSGRRRKGQVASVTRSRKDLLLGGFWCGLTLGLASFLQQKGLDTTSPGKAGFITALYIVLVPIFGIFLKKRVPKAVWVSVLLAVTGLYCLCITESFTIAPGDLCVMLCAFVFTAQILLVDHFVTVVDGVELPTVGQMQEISYAPKVKNLLISLAKNAGCSAKTAAGVAQIGRELLLESYRKALEEGTITVNPEKNKVTFPLENPETDFHTVGQLTRCPVFVHGWKLNYQSLEPAAEKEPPKPPTAEEYLLSHGYTITQQVRENELPPAAVQKLAWETGEAMRDTTAAAFLQFIRTHLQFYDSFTFRMPKDAPAESRELTVALAQSWDHLGLFSELSANPSRIVCTLASENDVVRNFVSGHWLELYVVHCVQKVLNRWQEQGAEVSLCSNVILSDSPENAFAHELDVAFSVNGRFFWVEAKSSSRNINYGKYADLCTKLQVTPDQLLLVNSDLSEEDCRGVAYFWPYRVANCATMEQKLEEMIAAGQDA